MAQPFPNDEPFLSGPYAPLHMECDAADLPVSGQFPKELAGWLYRNGPNPQFAPRGRYHWFAGDGMVHGFRIEDGRVAYRNRWVRTPKWELERSARESLSDSFGTPRLSDPRIVALNSTLANTNVVWHGGRLLALEEAHAPIELDPTTLATKGSFDYGGELVGPMTAHPKIDARTREMVCFGYAAKGRFTPDMMLHTVDRDGRLRDSRHLLAPYPSMVHDFAVTRDWIIVPIFPLTGSMERAMKGAPAYAWEPEMGTHVALVPRHPGAGSTHWFQADPCYVFHVLNAYDTAHGTVVCDVLKYSHAPLFSRPDGQPVSEHPAVARLWRWTFAPGSGATSFTQQPLDEHPGEFPRFDERCTGVPYRHGYFQAGSVQDAHLGREARNGLAHIDLDTGNVALWRPAPEDSCGEPIFVPRREDAGEAEGYLLSVIFRGQTQCSDLAVFDAARLHDGPLALAHLSHRVPAGFHGNWRALTGTD